ncbi:unnamed protein product [Adineta ricciae]|uniref:Uncharacterized protein n=1 Tax=Adineta ricciae TaxID=249248 RepID=A0A814CPK7_ADIRI|nr:unnamed protein product [Adineta ricciae]
MSSTLDVACNSIQHSFETASIRTSQSSSNYKTYISSSSISFEAESHSTSEGIPTDSWLIDLESKLSNDAVYDEFNSIPSCRLNRFNEDGQQSENSYRNRYIDVIPYNDTRVRLIPTRDNPYGYINASHVKFGIENTVYSYIATEFPLLLTIADFWRMIFDYNVRVIVMLLGDNEIQLGTNYFPKIKDRKYRTEHFEIELISEKNHRDFYLRQLAIKNLHGHETRSIVHLQYSIWNQKQLPLDTLSFLKFINLVDSFRRHYGETLPCVIHCTAGIGRTGMFILLHLMIQCITFNKKSSVANVLKVMREYRMSFVDRTHFYIFVYRCLIDYLKSSRLI